MERVLSRNKKGYYVDTISGVTVRMSSDSASYQRALVEAGIFREQDVIVGRF